MTPGRRAHWRAGRGTSGRIGSDDARRGQGIDLGLVQMEEVPQDVAGVGPDDGRRPGDPDFRRR